MPDAVVWKVKVVDGQNVLASKCPEPGQDCAFNAESAQKGTWDILYQQSLLMNLEDRTRFIANFQYTIMPNKAD